MLYNGKVAEVKAKEGTLTTFEMNVFHALLVWSEPIVSHQDDEIQTYHCHAGNWKKKQKSKLTNGSEKGRQVAGKRRKIKVPVAAQVRLSHYDFFGPNIDTGYHKIHGLDIKHCYADERLG